MKRKQLSQETKDKIRKAMLGRKASLETLKKLRLKRKPCTQETKDKIRKALLGRKPSSETLKKLSLVRKGKKRPPITDEWRENLRISHLGQRAWNKGLKGVIKANSGSFKKGVSTSPNTQFKKGIVPWVTGKKFPERSGKYNNMWKGGITPINQSIRTSSEYKLWRKSVFERDNWTCVWCGTKNGQGKRVILNADHIKPFSLFPELRFAIDNGRTLCIDCHKTTDTYGANIKKTYGTKN